MNRKYRVIKTSHDQSHKDLYPKEMIQKGVYPKEITKEY